MLEALTENNWDKIFIEFPTTNDKVDIALSKDDRVITAIQVKSTENTFAPASVKQWLKDIYNDYKADSYELVLIGQCTADTLHFINAIPKYYKRDTIKLDKTAARVLSGFDTSILDSSSVKIRSLPYDLNSLHSILVTSLLKYLSQDNVVLSYVKIDLLAKALISEQLLHSTDGSYTDRSSFESSLKSRIHSISETFRPHRIPVCIKSFTRDANHPDAVMEKTLDLCPVFDGRKIKPGLTWPENVFGSLIAFLTTATNQTERFKLYLETHTSIITRNGVIFFSTAVGLGAKRVYMYLSKDSHPTTKSFIALCEPYSQLDRDECDLSELPRDGIGCWHPLFPARADDMWLAACTSLKTLEAFFADTEHKTLTAIFENKKVGGIFAGYQPVDVKYGDGQ